MIEALIIAGILTLYCLATHIANEVIRRLDNNQDDLPGIDDVED